MLHPRVNAVLVEVEIRDPASAGAPIPIPEQFPALHFALNGGFIYRPSGIPAWAQIAGGACAAVLSGLAAFVNLRLVVVMVIVATAATTAVLQWLGLPKKIPCHPDVERDGYALRLPIRVKPRDTVHFYGVPLGAIPDSRS